MGKPSGKQTFRYKSAIIFGVTSVLPLLMFLFVLERWGLLQEKEVVTVLGLSVVIAVLGFFFFRRIVGQISALAEDFGRVERGEIQEVGERETPHEFAEMSRIADAFNRTLTDLKEHTKELENLVYKLSTLSELTDLVSHIPDIDEVLKIVLKRTMAVVNARIGSIMLLDNDHQALRIVAAEGLQESVVADTTIRLGEGISGKVAETGEPMLVEDIEKDNRFSRPNDPKYETSSFICMPLRANWRVMGVLNLSKKGNRMAFSETDMKFLTTMMSHIGFAVENARLLKEAKDAAMKLQRLVQEKTLQLDHAQQQVLQSVKLSALGQLIAGVAHELNNPLTTMMGYSQLLLTRMPEGKMRRDMGKIFDEAQRASKIVKNLLSFARQEPPEKRPCSINDLLRKILEMRSYDLKANGVEVTTALDKSLPLTLADGNQLMQVFLNIVNNANDAMMEQKGPRKIMVSTENNGDRARIEFTDTGPGIAPDHLDQIFDPFFTTKPEGKGTGLGLSVSYGIVKAHAGEIFVRSRPGEGTTFIVEVPIIKGAAALEPEEAAGVRPAIQRILVIDDEETIEDLITEILEDKGYHVDAASTGDLALRKLTEERYDLIICDLRLPGINGQELYDRMKTANPELTRRFIFLTGDIASKDVRAFLEGTGNEYIMKPFTADVLLETVDRAWGRIA